MWTKVSCVRKQHDGGNWASNHGPSDLKSNALTTTPPRPHTRAMLSRKNVNFLIPHFNLKYLHIGITFDSQLTLMTKLPNAVP